MMAAFGRRPNLGSRPTIRWQRQRWHVGEDSAENGAAVHIQEVDVEDAIEGAVVAVAAWTRRWQLRVSTRVERPARGAAAGSARPCPLLVMLLRLAATLAPRGAHIAVEARAGQHERTAHNGSSAEVVDLLLLVAP